MRCFPSNLLICTELRARAAACLMLLALSSFSFAAPLQPELPAAIANAPADAWVPVMVLSQSAAETNPVLLGMAQVSDIEDGYPYKVGLFKVNGASPSGNTGLSLQASASLMNVTPLCSNAPAPNLIQGASNNCEPVFGLLGAQTNASAQQLSLGAQYQLGPVRLGADVFHGGRSFTQFNPYLRLPNEPALTLLDSGKQTGIGLSGAIKSQLGLFGLQVQLAKSDLFAGSNAGFGPGLGSGQLNEGRLTFNWAGQNFGSSLSTRVLGASSTQGLAGSNLWGGIDLGLTWRTPWRGMLSIGAKNVVASGKPPTYLDPKRAIDAIDQERVPYVRYEQDL